MQLIRRITLKKELPLNIDQSHQYSWKYYTDLLWHLVWRDFNLRYKRSLLGVLWSLVFPLAQLMVLVFLFQTVVPLNIPGYPVFVFCALLPWSWFSSSIGSSCTLLIANRDLVRHPSFAPATLVLMNTLSNFITYLFALPILCGVLLFYNFPFTAALLFLPLLLLIQALLINGISLCAATLNVFYRDIQHIVSVTLTLLFYLTPVFYKSQAVSQNYQSIYGISPIAVLVQAYRSIFFYGVAPDWSSIGYAGLCSLVIYALGYAVYRYFQHEIIDVL